MSSGERRSSSFGYARSASLSLVAGTSELTTRAPSRARDVTSRQPIRPGNERSRNASSSRRPARLVDDVQPEGPETRGARARDDAPLERPQRDALAVDAELQLAREPGRKVRLAHLPAELVGGDLGEVERVPDVDRVPGELDPRIAVDGEVAERVGRRGAGPRSAPRGRQARRRGASSRKPRRERRPPERERRIRLERTAEPRPARVVPGEAALDHPAVEEEETVLGAERERAPRPRARCRAASVPVRDPRRPRRRPRGRARRRTRRGRGRGRPRSRLRDRGRTARSGARFARRSPRAGSRASRPGCTPRVPRPARPSRASTSPRRIAYSGSGRRSTTRLRALGRFAEVAARRCDAGEPGPRVRVAGSEAKGAPQYALRLVQAPGATRRLP